MKYWFTSDLHLFHANITKFCDHRVRLMGEREHNEMILDVWNETVQPGDIVYNLGDFSFGKPDETIEIGKKLNGQHFLIRGNHDKFLKDTRTHDLFVGIYDYKEKTIDKVPIVLFHYPIWEWNKMHYGGLMLHGHVHGTPTGIPGRILDVGFDAHPEHKFYEFDEIRALLKDKEVRTHHNVNSPSVNL